MSYSRAIRAEAQANFRVLVVLVVRRLGLAVLLAVMVVFRLLVLAIVTLLGCLTMAKGGSEKPKMVAGDTEKVAEVGIADGSAFSRPKAVLQVMLLT